MQSNGWFKLNDNGFGQITIEIGGKKIPLRFTVSQQERLLEMQEKRENEREGGIENKNILKIRAEEDLDTCHIALNPLPNKEEFSKDDISLYLDLDQQRLLASVWMTRKVLSPSASSINADLEASSKTGNR